MEILLLLGIYCVELVCYQVVLKILFQVEVRNRKWMVLGGVLAVVIGKISVDVAGKNFLITVSVIFLTFISLEGGIIENSVKLILIILLLVCVEGIFVYPCEKVFGFLDKSYVEHISYLVAKCCTLCSISLINVIKKKVIQFKKIHINSFIYFVIGIIIILMLICLGILKQAILYLPNHRYIIFCNMVTVAISISIFLLVIFVVYIKNTNERMEQLLKTERLLKESQVNYYKRSLRKEADTRKYRHDMINHLVYLQEILNKDQTKTAQRYLSNILGGFKKIQSIYYVTGNEMIDIIMNYYFGMLPKDVEIIIKGRSPIEFDIDETDICTIFSNLFQNIIEEITENHIKKSKISIEIHKGRQYIEYRIINTLSAKINDNRINKHGLPKSHKLNKRNHGIGLLNVKTSVERNYGNFKWYQEENQFIVCIILPIK